MQRFKSEQENFVFNTIIHWKPVEIIQNWADMSLVWVSYSSRVFNIL